MPTEYELAVASGQTVLVSPEQEYEVRLERSVELIRDISSASHELWTHVKWFKENPDTWASKYETFNEFCRYELGKDNSTIYRHIRDAEFKDSLLLEAASEEEKASILSMKESNTRFIRTLPEDAQIAFWKLAYNVGNNVLSKKEDGSIEPTTEFLSSVGRQIEGVFDRGGVDINGEFVAIAEIDRSAKIHGIDESTARALLISAGVSEDYVETLKRQQQYIREKSTSKNIVSMRGTVETRFNMEGEPYPILVTREGEIDLDELLCSYNDKFINISIKDNSR